MASYILASSYYNKKLSDFASEVQYLGNLALELALD